jgi:hypothetical protein
MSEPPAGFRVRGLRAILVAGTRPGPRVLGFLACWSLGWTRQAGTEFVCSGSPAGSGGPGRPALLCRTREAEGRFVAFTDGVFSWMVSERQGALVVSGEYSPRVPVLRCWGRWGRYPRLASQTSPRAAACSPLVECRRACAAGVVTAWAALDLLDKVSKGPESLPMSSGRSDPPSLVLSRFKYEAVAGALPVCVSYMSFCIGMWTSAQKDMQAPTPPALPVPSAPRMEFELPQSTCWVQAARAAPHRPRHHAFQPQGHAT